MEKRRFGATDMAVSVLGFGGAEIGFQGVPIDEVAKILNIALDTGLNVIDTAECYADSEVKIGATVSHRRDDFYLFTKCGHSAGFEEEDWNPVMLAKQIDRSLQRLKTDYLDLVQLHSCSKELLERGEVVEVLQNAKSSGKTRYIGYSGDQEAAKYAVECGHFDSLQTSVNVFDQQCIDLYLGLAKERNMGVIAKRPIGNAAWRYVNAEVAGYAGTYWTRLQDLKYEFENMAETALRFTLAQNVHVAIVGTTNPERWPANAARASKGALEADAVGAIRRQWAAVKKEDWVGQQ